MAKQELPLKEVSIEELLISGEKRTFEIPIYQRNYTWGKDEITALIQDVYDAYSKSSSSVYYIGTLVTYHKGDRVFEVIDGQQRLTTINIILAVYETKLQNKLTYRARKKADETLRKMPDFKGVDEIDFGIKNGFDHAKRSLEEIVPSDEKDAFSTYFRNNVHIIQYQVPKDIDLNHYFEIMNSRGEQLEKHEIEKSKLMERLSTDSDRKQFNKIWESCSELSVYIQRIIGKNADNVFGKDLKKFEPANFNDLADLIDDNDNRGSMAICDILKDSTNATKESSEKETELKDSFQPIIDFSNFLLIVLKITLMERNPNFKYDTFSLDDKELLNEFDNAQLNPDDIKAFAYNLLKARYLLDNYVVHHSKEEDTLDNNPWKLQVWQKGEGKEKEYPRNLCEDDKTIQDKLIHLLSMFEVSFTARQRKNYLFYVLLYLMNQETIDVEDYAAFVENLADRYFLEVYLDKDKLTERNVPGPGAFDEVILKNGKAIGVSELPNKEESVFVDVYGNGSEESKGIPLFVFNYLDYRLWKLYDSSLRGERLRENSSERRAFFEKLGCSDFTLNPFDQFYFSRTRRSLEHYYPQSLATGEGDNLDKSQINCFGNYAMIGSDANSSGSNWTPKTKLDHYLDASGKISQISVASLKFMVMIQICKDNDVWGFDEIREHQSKMINILIDGDY